jgi:hypothetical protein
VIPGRGEGGNRGMGRHRQGEHARAHVNQLERTVHVVVLEQFA